MSRVAKNPVKIPSGVTVSLGEGQLTIKGPKGELTRQIHPLVEVAQENNTLTFAPRNGEKLADALSGTTRALANNMVVGVTAGFTKKLNLVGVGYRAQVQGKVLDLTLGFSHPLKYKIPEAITVETPSQTEIVVKGADKQVVGQVAADIRSYRQPEPYKGKGVRYSDEVVVRKETKKK